VSRFVISGESISVQSGSLVYCDTLENFVLDYGVAAPALPGGAVCQLYEPGVRHAYSDGSNVIAGGELPWSFGDDAISVLSDLIATRAARIGADVIPEPDGSVGSRRPVLVAASLAVNVAGGDIPSMAGVYNIGAAIYLDVGLYMMFFINPLSSPDYFPVLQDGAHAFEVVDQQTDYLIVQARDAGGSAVDVPRFSVQIFMF